MQPFNTHAFSITTCLLLIATVAPATAAPREKVSAPNPSQGASPSQVSSVQTSEAESVGIMPSEEGPESAEPGRQARPVGKKEKTGGKKIFQKQPIAPADYARWEQLNMGNRRISRDGGWLVFDIRRVDEKNTLYLHRIKDGETTEKARFPQGERPVFSNDSKWLAVTIGKTPGEKKKARDSKTPPAPPKVHLRSLVDDTTTEFKSVGAVVFSHDSRFAAIEVIGKAMPSRPGAPPVKPSKALLVRNLKTGEDTTFGNVTRFSWSLKGSLLALVIDSPSISNSLQIFNPGKKMLKTLESHDQDYVSLLWRKDSFDLAAARQMKFGEKEDIAHVLLTFRELDKRSGFKEKKLYNQSTERSFPEGHYLTSSLSWTPDGQALYCTIKKWENRPKDFPSPPDLPSGKRAKKEEAEENSDPAGPSSAKEADPNSEPAEQNGKNGKEGVQQETAPTGKTLRETLKTPSNVEVWHSRDTTIMPRQKKEASGRKNPARRAIWWIEPGRFVQLESELTERVLVSKNGRRAIGLDHSPHERSAMFGPRLYDAYAINTVNGKRNRILEGVKFTLSMSPDGRFLLYLREGHVWSHDLKTGEKRNLSGKLDTRFTDSKDDTLAVEKRPFGNGVWFIDGSGVLLYDRYDIWLLEPQGRKSRRLTNGRRNKIRHRVSQASFDPDNRGMLDPTDPIYLALHGERSKKSGYARLLCRTGKKSADKLEQLLFTDAMVLYLERARDATVYTFTRERSDQPRNLFLGGPDLNSPTQITNTNEFQKDYSWGRSQLINFKNKHGVPLQGMLTYPAGYREGVKYPMIVYIYEKRSQDLHRYYGPSEKHPYNPCVFSAEGYFVFQPDIVYRPQMPGLSAVECVVPAVEKVLRSGMVDAERVGLMGHSWGAYQTSFIVTQTDLFSAAVAGAPLTDLMSMSVSVYWNTGGTNARIFSQSQGRMNKPFWRDAENYARNSPIHGLDSLNTPLLIAFGDKDGAVDWDQGIEMYNAARWAGKDDVVLLVYPGENHGLRKEENMVDYHYRVKEWMAHFLQKEAGGKWITEGQSFLDREKEKKEIQDKK